MVERYRIFAFTTFYRADSSASPLRAGSGVHICLNLDSSPQLFPNASGAPGTGQGMDTSCPVEERVM